MTSFVFETFFDILGVEKRSTPFKQTLRFWAVSDRASDRARRADSNALILASRGLLHPIF